MAGNNNRKKSRSKTNNEIKNKNSKNLSKQLTSSKPSSGNSNRRRIEEEDEGFLSENKSELIFILISVVSIVLLLSNFHLVGPVGEGLNKFLFGVIGIVTWIFPIYVFFASIFILAAGGRRRIRNKVLAAAGLLIALGGIFELIAYGDLREIGWGTLYTMSAENKNGGGFIGGSIAKLFSLGLAQVGAYLLLIAIIITLVIYLTGKLITNAISNKIEETRENIVDYREEAILDARAKADEKIARRKELREIRRLERERLREERAKEEERLRQEEMEKKRALSEELIQERIKNNIENHSKLRPKVENIVKDETKNLEGVNKEETEIIQDAENGNLQEKSETKDVNKEALLKEISKPEKEQLSFLIHRAADDKKADDNEEEPFYLKEIENKFGSEENENEEDSKIISDNVAKEKEIYEEIDIIKKISETEPVKENLWHSEMMGEEERNTPKSEFAFENAEDEESLVDDDIDEYEDLIDEEFYENIENDETKQKVYGTVEGGEPKKSILEIEKEQLLEKKTITGNKALESSFGDGRSSEGGTENIVKKEDGIIIEPIVSELSINNPPKPPKPYVFPPKNLLNKAENNEEGISDEELHETARKLQETLAAFGVNVKVTDVSCGPSVTRYELQPEQGVKVSKITALTDDIKLNLAAADIRIEAPIPGKAAVGIEVPNKKNLIVYFRDLIENKAFDEHQSKLVFAVGKDIGGQTMISDIAKMPHLLIAGATGSGKSVCINTLIMSILYKARPNEVKLIMVDPKVVELSVYNGIPHLLLPVVTDAKKAAAALNWAVVEMKRRYDLFAEMGVREIKGFNKKVGKDSPDWMPQIVIIVDELADLMMVSSKEVEDAICRLAQLARAAGIHLVIATQRPSVNVITGLIKANVPSRIAFAVSSQVDSRTILDGAGAEKLLGKGDMLFFPSGYPKPVRVQGAFISDNEVSDVVEFIKENNDPAHRAADITEQVNAVTQAENTKENNSQSVEDDIYDEYFDEAGRLVINKDKASIGMFQRVYRIGFNRAARIMDQLAEAGVVSEEDGTKARKILMSSEEFENFAAARHGE